MIITAPSDSIAVESFDRLVDLDAAAQVASYPVALIGDVMQRMGVVHPAIRPLTSHTSMWGSVLPVLCREGDNLAIHRALDEVRPGDVLVINALGETTRAVFGGILGEAFVAAGVSGVVIDGSVRDVADLDAMGVSVFARGVTPAGPYKHGPGSVGRAVACGGVVCHPGDLIVGDADGLVVLRPGDVLLAPRLLEQQVGIEQTMRARIA